MRPLSLMQQPHSRRKFVRVFALFAASSICPGVPTRVSVLADVQDQAQNGGGLLRLRLSDFPALLEEYGSVRLGTSPIGPGHLPQGLFYPVIITRAPQGRFHALDAACSHEGCTVPPFDPELRFIACPCHGSQYAIDGTLRRGPAGFGLRQFPVVFDGTDELTISLPDTSFSLRALRVEPSRNRIQLEFIAFENIAYEVYSRGSLLRKWEGPQPFSLTPSGPADQNVVVGLPHFASVFLDPAGNSGFYAVAMRAGEV